jgi:hypothetical protein
MSEKDTNRIVLVDTAFIRSEDVDSYAALKHWPSTVKVTRKIVMGALDETPIEIERAALSLHEMHHLRALLEKHELREQQRQQAERVLDTWAIWMPDRVVDEQLGDALEDINRRIREDQPRWAIRLKVAATMFWLTVHSIGYFLTTSGIRKTN